MIRVFFDHQYKFLGNNIRTFYEILINGLKEDDNFNVIVSNDVEESVKLITEQNFDIFQPTGFDNYFIQGISTEKQFFVIIPDMTEELFFEHCAEEYKGIVSTIIKNKAEQVLLCDRIIFTSDLTEKSFWKYFNNFKENLKETKFSKINYWGDNLEEGESLDFEYILYSDDRLNFVPHKMFYEFIVNVGETLLADDDLKLVITGYQLSDDEMNMLEEFKLTDSVIFKEKTKSLYRDALCCIFPSMFDGLNTALIEAINNDGLVLMNYSNPYFLELFKDKDVLFFTDEIFDEVLEEVIYGLTVEEYYEITKNQKQIQPQITFIEQYKEICKKSYNI